MKKQLIFLFLILTFAATAQRETVLDSTYLTNQGGQFFTVRVVNYSTGESEVTSKLVGDTAQLYTGYLDAVRQQAATLANDIRVVSEYKGRITQLIREADAASLIVGMDILDTITAQNAEPFTSQLWTIRTPDTLFNLTFTVNQNGTLRYRVNDGPAATANLLGDLLRLRNFPTASTNTDLARLPSGRWVDATKTYRIAPDGISNRNAPPPTQFLENTPLPESKTVKQPSKRKTRKP